MAVYWYDKGQERGIKGLKADINLVNKTNLSYGGGRGVI